MGDLGNDDPKPASDGPAYRQIRWLQHIGEPGRGDEDRLRDIKGVLSHLKTHLTDWSDIDKVSWECLPMEENPNPPAKVADRRTLAGNNYDWLCQIVIHAITSTNGFPSSDAIDDARICLISLHTELQIGSGLFLDESGEIATKKPFLKELSKRLSHIRRFYYTPIALARAKLALYPHHLKGGEQLDNWSPYLKVRGWMIAFKLAGEEISEDTFARRLKDGTYRMNPSSRKAKISLDKKTLPPAMWTDLFWQELRKNTAGTPHNTANED